MNPKELRHFGQAGDSADLAADNETLRKTLIEHPVFCEIVREIARIHARGRDLGVAEGLLLVAQTGAGKSTLLDWYRRRFPREVVDGVHRIPVVTVVTPEAPGVKSLAEAVLHALRDPAASKGTAPEKTARILHFFKLCHVELLMIDEFQHFYDGRRGSECARVSDWLKNLISESEVPVVLAGLPRSIAVINRNPQLRRRFGTPLYMRPFDIGTPTREKEFRSVLKAVWENVRVPCIELHNVNIARRFYFATSGLMDYVIKIIEEAVTRGQYDRKVGISLETLEAAFRSAVWQLAPAHLNPFSAKPVLRRLGQTLEPFDIWDDPDQYQISRGSKIGLQVQRRASKRQSDSR